MTAPDFPHPQVIIVGSGPAGTSAAWPLVEAGVRVLMLDAARDDALPAPPIGSITTFRRDPARWKFQFGEDLSGVRIGGDHSPKMTTPLARAMVSRFAAENALVARDFLAAGSLEAGGLSRIWGAVTTPYDDRDLSGFPFGHSELTPYYAKVTQRIGVSSEGRLDDSTSNDSLFPSPPIAKIAKRYRLLRGFKGFHLDVTENAILRQRKNGRQECAQCGLCLWGCHRDSVYSSEFELPTLKTFPNFSYRSGAIVKRIFFGDSIYGLQIKTALGLESLTAPTIVLAAGTIATTSLVLGALERYNEPIRLLTNPVAALAFVVPELFMASLPERSFSLGQLSHLCELRGDQYAAGVLYSADALPLALFAQHMPFSRPLSLRLARALAPSLVLATCYLPGHYSRSTMRIAAGETGAKLSIDAEPSPEAKRTLKEAGDVLSANLRRCGAIYLPGTLRISPAGSDAHYAGTLPMGAAGPLGCSDIGELNGCPGLFVADASLLPALPPKHCTLTVMAIATRIGAKLADRVRNPAAYR